jgi:hypothetical protein
MLSSDWPVCHQLSSTGAFKIDRANSSVSLSQCSPATNRPRNLQWSIHHHKQVTKPTVVNTSSQTGHQTYSGQYIITNRKPTLVNTSSQTENLQWSIHHYKQKTYSGQYIIINRPRNLKWSIHHHKQATKPTVVNTSSQTDHET